MRRILLSFVIITLPLASTYAQTSDPNTQPQGGPTSAARAVKQERPQGPYVRSFVVEPAAAPRRAMLYELRPHPLEQKEGNAAVLYLQAITSLGRISSEQNKQLRKMIKMPLGDFPQEKAAELLESWHPALGLVETAARCAYSDWQTRSRIRKEGYMVLLPHLAPLRQLTMILALRARLQIAQGRYDEAIETLKLGMTMAQHARDGQVLISNLVGISITMVMLDQLQTLIQQPGSPNLYWALTDLPQPLIPIRQSIGSEGKMLVVSLPELGKLAGPPMSCQQVQASAEKLMSRFATLTGGEYEPSSPRERLRAAAGVIAQYPKAKRYLIAQGRPRQEVQAMAVTQVSLLYSLQRFRYWRDETYKWFCVPYWQAEAGIHQTSEAFVQAYAKRDGWPFTALMPALEAVHQTQVVLDRRIAALRCIEAFRMYAAEHGGRLPESLDKITQVPVPIDPVTGKPFGYKLDGDKAVLTGRTPRLTRAKKELYYEIRLAKPKSP